MCWCVTPQTYTSQLQLTRSAVSVRRTRSAGFVRVAVSRPSCPRSSIHPRRNGHDERAALNRRRAAHARAERDPHARRAALKGPDHELPALEEIEAGPVHLRQSLEDERRGVGGVGDRIALAREQRSELLRETRVVRGLVVKLVAADRVAHALRLTDSPAFILALYI